jgi:tetratricopeptide (TPR) repeat protein
MQNKFSFHLKNCPFSSFWNLSGLTSTFFILLLLASSADLSAQSRLLKKADAAYDEFNYNKALKRYQRVEAKGGSKYHVTKRIADCYRQLNMPTHAVEWYEKAIAFHDVDAETYYHLGLALRTLKRYEESDVYLDKFHTIMRTHKPRQGLSAEDYLYHLRSDSGRFDVSHLDINSPYSEFGPALLDDNQLIFSSIWIPETISPFSTYTALRWRILRNYTIRIPFYQASKQVSMTDRLALPQMVNKCTSPEISTKIRKGYLKWMFL